MKKLTVLMPTYNKADSLGRAVMSVLIQETDYEYEIIIIDDKSTDGSLDVALDFQFRNPDKIKIIRNDANLKLIRTILKGYAVTKTDYFTVLDPDDYYIAKDKFRKAIRFLEKHPEYAIYAADTYVEENGKRKLWGKYKNRTYDFTRQADAPLGHTSGSIYRNVVFKEGLPKKLVEMSQGKYKEVFRGDYFRNMLHYTKGKAYLCADVESVYCMHGEGIWTSLDPLERTILNTQAKIAFSRYFDGRASHHFIKSAYGSIHKCFRMLSEPVNKLAPFGYNMPCIQQLAELYNDYLEILKEKGLVEEARKWDASGKTGWIGKIRKSLRIPS